MLGYTTSAVPGENHTLKENYGLSAVPGLRYGNCHLARETKQSISCIKSIDIIVSG